MAVEVRSWMVKKLADAFSEGYEGTIKLEMPQYQRGPVWSSNKQADLIRALKQGFPIGSLLFFKKSSDGTEVNLLIDGLQRTTAICEYKKRPLSLMELSDIDVSVRSRLEEVFKQAAKRQKDLEICGDISKIIEEWMFSTKTLEPRDGFDSFMLFSTLNDSLANKELQLDRDLNGGINEFLGSVKKKCDISNIEIPILFYDGQESNLPEIFEAINSTGTKLSKYQIFAASWVTRSIEIKNEKVMEAIRKRYYTFMTKNSISINGVGADGTPNAISLFDYLFGLGKHLEDKFKLLFGGTDDPTEMESVAFALATVCHKLPLSKMSDLPGKMDTEQNCIKPDKFEDALIESADFVQKTLAPFINIKLNSESSTLSVAHSDLQIASMVARAFCGKYKLGTWEIMTTAEDDRKQLSTYLPQHYLVDILQQNWRGAGDSRLYQMVWDVDDNNIPQGPSKYYLQALSKDEFERVVDQWFSEQIKLNQRSQRYVTAAARTFLKYLYSNIVTVKEENKITFELDHIFPVSRLAELAKEDGWPISAIANLVLFDWETNREKSKMDLVQYLEKLEEKERPKKKEAIEKYLLLPIEKTAMPLDGDNKDILKKEEFLVFLQERFKEMKQKVFDTLDIEMPEGGPNPE